MSFDCLIMWEKKSTILEWFTFAVFLSGDLGGYHIKRVCLMQYYRPHLFTGIHLKSYEIESLKDIHFLFEMDSIFNVRGMNIKSSLVTKLAKSPMRLFFFAWLKKISGKKPHPPGAFPEVPLYTHCTSYCRAYVKNYDFYQKLIILIRKLISGGIHRYKRQPHL